MTGGPEPISDAAREALDRELADLRAERETVAATLRGGERVGDRADEADELQRGTELDRLDTRIAEIDGRLREAAVAGPPRTDKVGVGSTVTVRFADATETTVQIGEVAEALDRTLVTADSPLGRALLGRRAGDTISYETPEGRSTAVVLSLGDGENRS
ncbi:MULTISPECIES: GreA/GreB family elongation factor [unclassified Streptomyces]|uniref:GreA/GreB family elongation factor n=1 Tax=unclassified Streptomyces TaxID=2593676 RepID=UPI002DD9BBEE|nr:MULTISPECIES: GreA/GreB family elongation factor [unclassified Streptomyces]WSF82912.1 GreA/GreB family elongation factor [Streptomyces sp. NBC_01744]WSC40829.1 GreA/GreB family elongation factor [Streptomyces sp. NBC_01763]WSC48960.1 GreA/GreB family elongation factor [Streptomyces sp. NBC_01762]WSC52064.1 GreA/GreB family elongation factor [Streptomyces sp. NBC_01761]WSD28614.1 GreA/GreB family elongation factor [Streptomyces sp. NBC_01751]